MTNLARTPFFADPKLDSRFAELPGAGGVALFLTPKDEPMKFSELLQSGDYDAARKHPQYLNNVQVAEQLIVAADQHRKEQLCGQHYSPLREMPKIGGIVIDAWQAKQMSTSFEETKRLESLYA